MPTSPMARRAKETPRTAPASPEAVRELSVTWVVTASTPMNMSPIIVKERPNTTDPPAGRPMATSEAPTSTPTTRFMALTTTRAAAEGGVAADRHRVHQLQPAALLLGPGEAPDHEDRHQRHHGEPERADLERDLAADRVEAVGGTVEGQRRRVVDRRRRGDVEVVLGGVEALDAGGGDHDEDHDRHDPHRDAARGPGGARTA